MYHFFVEEKNITDEKILIDGADFNHIKNVLRMTISEKVTVTAGDGYEYLCEIEEFFEDEVSLSIIEKSDAKTELPVKITLFQALPKKDKMELIIQKAVELGAVRIVPYSSKRCVVKLDDKKSAKKIARWQSISESAAKQSGRGIIPEVSDVMTFKQAIEYAKNMDFVMIPYEKCENMSESVKVISEASSKECVGIFIGPEGGFDESEVDLAVKNGIIPISLGKRILRTETAGLAILSVLMFNIEGKE